MQMFDFMDSQQKLVALGCTIISLWNFYVGALIFLVCLVYGLVRGDHRYTVPAGVGLVMSIVIAVILALVLGGAVLGIAIASPDN